MNKLELLCILPLPVRSFSSREASRMVESDGHDGDDEATSFAIRPAVEGPVSSVGISVVIANGCTVVRHGPGWK